MSEQAALSFAEWTAVTIDPTRRDRLERAVNAICEGYELRIEDYYHHEIGFDHQCHVVRVAARTMQDVLRTAEYMRKGWGSDLVEQSASIRKHRARQRLLERVVECLRDGYMVKVGDYKREATVDSTRMIVRLRPQVVEDLLATAAGLGMSLAGEIDWRPTEPMPEDFAAF